MAAKLRPGWAYNSKGKAVPVETLEQHETKRTIAKWSQDNGSGARKPKVLKHPFVLDGRVRMTPRRYELLSAVLTETLQWTYAADFMGSHGGAPSRLYWAPLWGGKHVDGTLTTLHKLRLIRWQRGAEDITLPNRICLTASGLRAIEEYEENLKGVTQP